MLQRNADIQMENWYDLQVVNINEGHIPVYPVLVFHVQSYLYLNLMYKPRRQSN